ncbi:MAG: hypothetical protein CMB55_00895 [Euryarchaeota archaeon]|nr:hypothetical protein [Euryarchaeota archaeon]|tara:strand:- start:47 stop:508 length:462 start_codon:yes stop_codon:yes gene_type:complete
MTDNVHTGASTVERLAGRDLNQDGKVINLVICGDSRFYNYEWIEEQLEQWIDHNDYPDLVIVGGASGVDYLAERWADNQAIPIAIFTEAWNEPRKGLEDSGRPEAPTTLGDKLLDKATHFVAFPGPKSKWTKIMIERARAMGIPAIEIPIPEY